MLSRRPSSSGLPACAACRIDGTIFTTTFERQCGLVVDCLKPFRRFPGSAVPSSAGATSDAALRQWSLRWGKGWIRPSNSGIACSLYLESLQARLRQAGRIETVQESGIEQKVALVG